MRFYAPLLAFTAAVSLTACSSSSNDPAPSPSGDSLTTLLQTGVDSSDVTAQWDCDGLDGQDPVSFSQRFFANGEGQIVDSGLTLPITWSADSDTSFSVVFAADGGDPAETESLTNVSFSTVNIANDQYDGIDARDGSALSCAKTETSSVASPLSLVDTIVNVRDTVDFGWNCSYASTPGSSSSYEFLADGTGRRFTRGFTSFTADPPAMTWTADEANFAINISWNGQTGDLGAVAFQDEDNFTAVDSFEAESMSCVRSDTLNAPTPPVQPQPISTCLCNFTEVEQFLVDSNEPCTTVLVSNIAGGRILDIDLPGTTFQLSARNLGVRDCAITFTGTNFTGENNQNFSGIATDRIADCDAQLDSLINNN